MMSKKFMLFLLIATAVPVPSKAAPSVLAKSIVMLGSAAFVVSSVYAVACIGEGLILPYDQEHAKRRDEVAQQFRTSIQVMTGATGLVVGSVVIDTLIDVLKQEFASTSR